MVEPGPHFSVADCHRGWRKGFAQAGAQVVNFNFADRLSFYAGAHLDRQGDFIKAFTDDEACNVAAKGVEAAVLEVWPDLVFITSGFFIPPAFYELMRARNIRTCILHLESPYEDVRQMGRAALSDYNIVNDPTNLTSFRDVNPRTWYIPHAYDPDLHKPGPARPEVASDFAFVGTGYQSRIEFLESVDWTDVDVALAGNWQELTRESPLRKFVAHDLGMCCDNEETVTLYQSTKISANLYRREAEHPSLTDGWAMGPREVELAATGTFFLRSPRGESDELFPMLPTFGDPEEFGELLRWWLHRDAERNDRVRSARAAVQSRTFLNNAQQLLRLIQP